MGDTNFTKNEVVDCPVCSEMCGWCSWTVGLARTTGCGCPSGPGRRRHRCEKAQALKGSTCSLCGNTGKVLATTTYRVSEIDAARGKE